VEKGHPDVGIFNRKNRATVSFLEFKPSMALRLKFEIMNRREGFVGALEKLRQKGY